MDQEIDDHFNFTESVKEKEPSLDQEEKEPVEDTQ